MKAMTQITTDVTFYKKDDAFDFIRWSINPTRSIDEENQIEVEIFVDAKEKRGELQPKLSLCLTSDQAREAIWALSHMVQIGDEAVAKLKAENEV